MTLKSSGLFVTLDGPGGVGKSTALELSAVQLDNAGALVHTTVEPSRASLGYLARHGTETYQGRELACLIAADRYHHVRTEVQPALDQGYVVLCDRYIASSLVLQRLDGVDQQMIWELNRHVLRPDLSVILTAAPGVIAKRLQARGAHSRFERMHDNSAREATLFTEAATFLQEAGFHTLVIDCTTRSPAQVAEAVSHEITALLTGR
ncbi:dTMP kinase [Streptomyces sp. UNOC14_S4]|uniref:dTMP kinase n=1 Tax=Streptomyces sp. UNOC14_S4 TaxID=2872340 RepID=UPI001E3FEFAA|nr:dTMP kinase [Streptomyces sp. UNOC14_S4]MCC3766052.1 dTMP kinase [Streptomyces sp. UNOC14_S4]